jgi:hypothetical protein
MVSKAITAVVLFLVLAPASWGIDPEKNGIFRIRTPEQSQGTAFAIEQIGDKVYLGTAAHVVLRDDGRMFQGASYTLENDTIKDMPNAKVVATDVKADVAVIQCTTTKRFELLALVDVAEDLRVDKMGFGYRPSNVKVTLYGYGSGNWLETFGKLSFATRDSVYGDCTAAPGQSGGPAVIDTGIVGVVSGGSEWHKASEDAEKNVTWPARLGSGRRLKELLEWAKQQK